MRKSSEVKPSRKFSRLPHWISGPQEHARGRVVEEVGERVLALLERVVRLGVAVVDVQHRVAHRARPLRVPVEVEEGDDADEGQGLAHDRGPRVLEVVLDPDVHGRVVHVVLDALAVDEREPRHVLAELQVRGNVDPPAGGVAAEVELVGVQVVPLDLAQDARDLDVAPVARLAEVRREVGKREASLDVLELDAARVLALVGAGARPLEGDRHARVSVRPRRPAELHVPEEHHAVRAPVLDRVREDVDVHERAPGLARADLTQLAPGVPEPERGLPRVHAGAEQLELEDGLDLADVGRDEALHAEAALADAGEVVAVLAELVLERGQLGRPQDVEPVRVVLLRLIPHVEHGEAVDVQPGLRLGRGGGSLGRRGRRSGRGRRLGARGCPARLGVRERRGQQEREHEQPAESRPTARLLRGHDGFLLLLSELNGRWPSPRPSPCAAPRRRDARSCPCAASRSPRA